MKLDLKSDWTLAHFLSYIAGIFAVLLFIQLLTQLFIFNQVGMDFPVKYSVAETEQISSITKSGYMFLPKNEQNGLLIVMDVENRSGFHSFILAALKIIESATFIFCAFLVWRIFQSVANDDPFSKANYKRLFIVGWIFILADFFAFGRAYYIDWLAFDTFASESFKLIRTTGDISTLMIIGIVIIVIGYVFKEGHRIYEEQKLTV
jgi:hypothetical protein